MRIVALEEHVILPELVNQIPAEAKAKQSIDQSQLLKALGAQLADITGERLASMDRNGISMQVLSVGGPGADLLGPKEAPAFARQYNDVVAERITAYPERFAAFAHLPLVNPEAAAAELERTVSSYGFKGALIDGMIGSAFLDHPQFAPVLAKAEALGVPIYLHPGLPPKAVYDAYFSQLPKFSGQLLSIAGWGWHSETAIHLLRLIFSGTLDRYPALKIIVGHMGEMLPMMISRLDDKFGRAKAGTNERLVSETLQQQVYATTSGIFSKVPLQAVIDTFGIDRVMFSVDYPFSTNEEGKTFLDSLLLPAEAVAKLAHGNADQLLGLRA